MESCWILRARVDKGLQVRKERDKKNCVCVIFGERIFSINIGQEMRPGNPLEVQWLRLRGPNACSVSKNRERDMPLGH